MSSPKYPRIPHLPWSPGGTSDVRRMSCVDTLIGVPVVFTEKMDGSNVCLERNALYARSHNGPPSHPSFDLLKSFHDLVKYSIPNGYQVFGEWLYANHNIYYTELPSYLMLFGVRDLNRSLWLSWKETELIAEDLGFPMVPRCSPWIENDVIDSPGELESLSEYLRSLESQGGSYSVEGVVVRLYGEFSDDAFPLSIAKWVRKNHVQTDEHHWDRTDFPKNELRK